MISLNYSGVWFSSTLKVLQNFIIYGKIVHRYLDLPTRIYTRVNTVDLNLVTKLNFHHPNDEDWIYWICLLNSCLYCLIFLKNCIHVVFSSNLYFSLTRFFVNYGISCCQHPHPDIDREVYLYTSEIVWRNFHSDHPNLFWKNHSPNWWVRQDISIIQVWNSNWLHQTVFSTGNSINSVNNTCFINFFFTGCWIFDGSFTISFFWVLKYFRIFFISSWWVKTIWHEAEKCPNHRFESSVKNIFLSVISK